MLKLFWIATVATLVSETTEPVPSVSDKDPSCACVAQGKRWAQGEVACISGRSMKCSMNQNLASWASIGESCQVSSHLRVQQSFTPM